MSLCGDRVGPPVDNDRRFTGPVLPTESLTLRIVPAASAGGRAFIIDVSRFRYVVQKSKITYKFFIARPPQPAGRKIIAQPFMPGDRDKKQDQALQGRKNLFPGEFSDGRCSSPALRRGPCVWRFADTSGEFAQASGLERPGVPARRTAPSSPSPLVPQSDKRPLHHAKRAAPPPGASWARPRRSCGGDSPLPACPGTSLGQ